MKGYIRYKGKMAEVFGPHTEEEVGGPIRERFVRLKDITPLVEAAVALQRRLDDHFGGYDWEEQEELRAALASFVDDDA